MRPPLLERLAYRASGWRLDARYVPWIVEDVRSGRALRWRWVTCGVAVTGTQLLLREAYARQGAPGASSLAVLGGAGIGLLLGSLLVRRQGTERQVARALRAQGFLADGRPDPRPSWAGRLDNHGIAAIQLASVALLGFLAGVLPTQLGAAVVGSCTAPDAATVTDLRGDLRPGLALHGVRSVRARGITLVAAVVEGRGVVTWQRLGDGGRLMGADPDAGVVTPALGSGTPFAGGAPPWGRALTRVAACAERAASEGKRPDLEVPVPAPAVPSGVVQLRGAIDLDLRDVVASCGEPEGTGSADLPGPAGTGGFLLVRGPTANATVVTTGPAGPSGRAFSGRLAAVTSDELVVEGVLQPPRGQPGPALTVAARLPCG